MNSPKDGKRTAHADVSDHLMPVQNLRSLKQYVNFLRRHNYLQKTTLPGNKSFVEISRRLLSTSAHLHTPSVTNTSAVPVTALEDKVHPFTDHRLESSPLDQTTGRTFWVRSSDEGKGFFLHRVQTVCLCRPPWPPIQECQKLSLFT